MTRSLHCGAAVHTALTDDPVAFARCTLIGYQQVEAYGALPADLLELRNCPHCHTTMSREIGAPIVARLERARREDDIAMIARCRRTLGGDAGALQSFRDAMALESLMTRSAEAV